MTRDMTGDMTGPDETRTEPADWDRRTRTVRISVETAEALSDEMDALWWGTWGVSDRGRAAWRELDAEIAAAVAAAKDA